MVENILLITIVILIILLYYYGNVRLSINLGKQNNNEKFICRNPYMDFGEHVSCYGCVSCGNCPTCRKTSL